MAGDSPTDRQSLYTAIGHLAVHGSSAGVPTLLLVVPAGAISDDVNRAVWSILIELVRYSSTGDGYAFDPPLSRS